MKQQYSDLAPQTGIHVGGICRIDIAPKEWLQQEIGRNFLTNTVSSNILLKSGKAWLTLSLLEHTYNFSEKVKNADAGQYYDVEISGELNKIDAVTLQTLNTFRFHKFVAMVTDMKGRQRVVGNLYSGLALLFGTDSKNDSGGEDHLPIALTMQSPETAPYLDL